MKRFVFPTLVILVLLWSQSVLADSLSLAKQWEARGNYLKAAEEYSMAAAASNNLNRKAELMYEVGRCRIKAGEAAYIGNLISDIKSYASDKGAKYVPKLLTQLEELAWKLDDEAARQAFSIIVSENPNRRKTLSEKANAKDRKALAYWLDPSLNEADCRAKRAKALKEGSTAEVASQLAVTRDICKGAPSETEHKTFSARANTESNDQGALPLYEQIKIIWGFLDQPSIDRLVTYGRKIRVIEGNEAEVERIRKILPDIVVGDKLAREVAAPAGEWGILYTKGGERTPYLVAPAIIGDMQFIFNDCNFEIVTHNGRRFNLHTADGLKKFHALGDIPKFYAVAAPISEQPASLSIDKGYCIVKIKLTARN